MQIELTITVPYDEDGIGIKNDINRALISRTPIKVTAFGKSHLVEVQDVRVD